MRNHERVFILRKNGGNAFFLGHGCRLASESMVLSGAKARAYCWPPASFGSSSGLSAHHQGSHLINCSSRSQFARWAIPFHCRVSPFSGQFLVNLCDSLLKFLSAIESEDYCQEGKSVKTDYPEFHHFIISQNSICSMNGVCNIRPCMDYSQPLIPVCKHTHTQHKTHMELHNTSYH